MERSASRTTERLTPNRVAREASDGRRVPTPSSPPSMAERSSRSTASAAPTRVTVACLLAQLSDSVMAPL